MSATDTTREAAIAASGELQAELEAEQALPTEGVEVVERPDHPAGLLRFESFPAGTWRTKKGDPAKKDKRGYYLNGQELPSVSSITGTLSAEALIYWAEDHGMRGAVEAYKLGLFDGVSPENYIHVAKANGLGASAARDDGAARGHAIHAAFEILARTGKIPNPAEFPEAWRPYVTGCVRAWLALKPGAVEIEHMVCNPELGYAGRLDLVAAVEDVNDDGLGRCLTLIDYKTGKGKVYDKAHYQTRLYDLGLRCEGIRVDRILIVGISDEGEFDPVTCAATDEDALSVLATYTGRKRINADMAAERKARKARLKAAA